MKVSSNEVNIANELRGRLKKAVQGHSAEGLLFSGGLDTSVLAVLNPNMNPAPRFWMPRHLWRGGKRGGVKAITVSLESFGEDAQYADLVARNLKLNHYHRKVSIDEAIDSIPNVIRILKSFDPAIPNDLVVYFGLERAKEMGIGEIMTGDGSDELFAGYSFMQKIDDLEGYIRKVSQNMRFSSNRIGDFFGIKIVQPFLEKEVVDFALLISPNFKLKERDGKLWGKWILRKAFEKLLSAKIIWQDKRPLEYGSGMRRLREIITSKISDEEFEDKSKQYLINPVRDKMPEASAPDEHRGISNGVKFMNKEHLYYYEIYKKEVGEIPVPEDNQKACPGCGAGMDLDSFHCKVCGYVLDWKV